MAMRKIMKRVRCLLPIPLFVFLCLIIVETLWIYGTSYQTYILELVSLNAPDAKLFVDRLEKGEYGYPLWTPHFSRKGRVGGKDLPRILFWTTIYGDWYSGMTDKQTGELEFEGCADRCYITNDRRLLNSSDAVVFYGRDLNLADMPQRRARGQKWVYWSLEPPNHCVYKALTYLNNSFNWTMTYRYDSDVLNTYGKLTKISAPTPYSLDALHKLWEGKSKMAVWPVSNCVTFGKREDYVAELKKYITVDVFGKCGRFRCDFNWQHTCHRMFQKKYFFYLSFENAVCKDYVTEKFYVALLFDLIPVVFGGADYSSIAPPGSYIDALSFKTPKHLADHLRAVAKDFNLYKRYFSWRGQYSAAPLGGYNYCNLCNKLHSEHYNKTTVYKDFLHWWNTSSQCQAWNRNTNQLYV